MPRKKWVVFVDWIDGIVEDTDEVSVFAETAAEAKKKALAKWMAVIQPRFLSCRPSRAWIMSAVQKKLIC